MDKTGRQTAENGRIDPACVEQADKGDADWHIFCVVAVRADRGDEILMPASPKGAL